MPSVEWRNENEVSVDLKWSLWSTSADHWQNYCRAGEVWDAMLAAFRGKRPALTVYTSPRKEIRYGEVVVGQGRASGYFYCEWGEPYEVAEALGLFEDFENDDDWELWIDGKIDHPRAGEYSTFLECLPFSEYSCNGEPQVLLDFSCYMNTFQELMDAVDRMEDSVCKESERLWEELEKMWRKPQEVA